MGANKPIEDIEATLLQTMIERSVASGSAVLGACRPKIRCADA
jgi:hypothetical protein